MKGEQMTATTGSAWRWGIAVAVMALIAYPAARWAGIGGGGAAVAPASAGARELQSSFEHYRAGRYQEAVTAARASLAANPNSAEAYNNLAVSYMGLRQIDDAIQASQEAIRIRPDFQLAKNNLAWLQREKAKAALPPPTAAQAAEAAALLNQSLQHYQAKRYTECLDTALRSARVNPNSAQALNNAGICAGNLQLWDEGIRNAQEAILLDPGFQLAKNNLAWLQQEKLKADAAKAR